MRPDWSDKRDFSGGENMLLSNDDLNSEFNYLTCLRYIREAADVIVFVTEYIHLDSSFL